MVKWVKIGDLLEYEQPTKYLVDSTEYDDRHRTPVLTAGQSFILGYTNETAGIYKASSQNPTIIFDDFTTNFHFVSFDFKVKSSAMKMLRPKKDDVSFKYVYYSMLGIKYTPAEHARQWISCYSNFEIPLPSLSEQQRIVDILDKFEGMVENVEKELLLRQKQYEVYREKMMNCLRCDSVKWVKIGDEGSFYSGLSGKNKNDFVNGNAKFVTYMNVYTNVALNFDIEDKVQIRDTERQNTIEYGDILFTGSSETPDECGMSCVVTQVPEESIHLNSFCFGYRFNSIENIQPDYCKHLFRSNMIRSAIAKTANGVTRFNVSKKLFANIEIPLPSLAKQQEIVAKLDKFEEMISALKRELELRKKQYEYYREKLLTFE